MGPSTDRQQNHQPRKRFGQNFLTDKGIIDKIVAAIAPKPGEVLIEIGPGQGAITEPLLAFGNPLHVIEIDRDLAAKLRTQQMQHANLFVHEADALKFSLATLCHPTTSATSVKPALRIVGNLPYNISTPLIFHLLKQRILITDMHFMLQQEVVDRLAAEPGNKTYGRLSIMAQVHCDVAALFSVPPECFSPRPKVNSAIVRLTPLSTPLGINDYALFSQLVNLCFQQRRKTLRNSLKQLCSAETLSALRIDLSTRPDQLSVQEYVDLSNMLNAAEKKV